MIETAEFGRGGNELISSQRSAAGDAGQDLVPTSERDGGDQISDLGFENFDMPLDLLERLPAPTREQQDSEILFAVIEGGPNVDYTVPRIHEFSYLDLLLAPGKSGRRRQGGRHAGQKHGIDATGFGQRAGGLSKAPGTVWVELHARPAGQRSLQLAVIDGGRLVGDPFDRPLSNQAIRGLVALTLLVD